MSARIEIMRRNGEWVRSEISFPNVRELYRFAAALGMWIGIPYGNVAAVRVLHSLN